MIPDRERDACGIGFVADASGRASRDVVDLALEALCRVRHRGAVAADALTGDGAGVLLPLPATILSEFGPPGSGAAMVFLDPAAPEAGRRVVENACSVEGIPVHAWRPVPVDPAALGSDARRVSPLIEQAVLAPVASDAEDAERACFRARRRIENEARTAGTHLYICSLSYRTITYKALCAADQLAAFYGDLSDDRYGAWFALFHQRYSTNTTPTWDRAQPFRFLGHNGEINTIRGNVALMRSREGRLGPGDWVDEDLLKPVINSEGSDSQILDETLELLVRGGRTIDHATAMLMPPAWEAEGALDEDTRSFFRFHSCLLEPWDGPAAIVYADGVRVGAGLDRNGLRPLRVSVRNDGLIACASEAGAVPMGSAGRIRRTKVGPGCALIVDPARGGLVENVELKKRLASLASYGDWVKKNTEVHHVGNPVPPPERDPTPRQVAAGWSKEELTVVVRPMAVEGVEPTSSMGDDTAQPPLANYPRVIFNFLKQRFAQVTNPPIDHLRERHVMSITTRLGPRAPLLQESADAAALREYPSFVLYPSGVRELEDLDAAALDATFEVQDGPDGLEDACRRLSDEAEAAVHAGHEFVIVTDRNVNVDRAPVPSALAAGAVHHRLLKSGLRSQAALVVEADDVRETHHVACLLTNGADAVCPSLALESLAHLASRGRLGGDVPPDEAQRNFVGAIEDGLLKVMSKMGISTLDSYRGAQIIEAIGLGDDVIDLCFSGLYSPLKGLSLVELGVDVLQRHEQAFETTKTTLGGTGFIKHKKGGEYHAINPDVVDALHEAVGLKEAEPTAAQEQELEAAHELRRAVKGDEEAYARFAKLANERPPTEPRDLLEIRRAPQPLPLDDVEPASEIVKRFSTGAMSHGALSAEAHETLSIALNMIGGNANTGEGGEDPARYRDHRNSAIKQIASGRFGVTPDYLAFADELQIKMAQGSKPGEGGQLPGKKVSVEIARLRHTVPGVALISPPPHHDIYSIEDLAQLIFDLKQANPRAAVSVKLVSSQGVGTIAAGVIKGLADVVHISGGDGGTGASPLSSIKNAGLPWEVGLADTQDALVSNDLRSRARVRVDGGFKTGRDVVLGALLGADEYSFGTAMLIAEGCILVRTCHRNTCPVGIATQDPKLRAKFEGTPEMVARYLLYVADEVRGLLAGMGLRSLGDAIGRTDLLSQGSTGSYRADSLDLSVLLAQHPGRPLKFVATEAVQKPRSDLGDRLYEDAMAAFREDKPRDLSYEITTGDRTVGARLGSAVGYELSAPKPARPIRANFEGQAGQSFGAFLSEGIELVLKGEANDYVCKGMGGGRVVIRPPEDDAGRPCLAGNTILYGATGGQLFIAGSAGERFAVRNSGAVAVVEGTGDHACEYMTAGAVVILGPTGINLGAGMSGGEAYVHDPAGVLDQRINPQLVGTYDPKPGQLESLRRVIQRHHDATGSPAAAVILADWESASKAFRRVAPKAEVARLEALFEGTAAAAA